MFGIYIITNEVNDKCYVGKTGRTFDDRFNDHLYDLRKNQHYNKHLQRAWNKYSEENFTFDILEIVEDVNLLNEKEIYWISYYDSHHNGYNNTDGGEGTNGFKWSEEQKQNISGEKNPFHGKHHNDDFKQKHSDYMKSKYSGKKNPMYGKEQSEETRKKISEKTKERMKNLEERQKISETLKGNKLSEETKRKISEILKGKKYKKNKRTTEMYENIGNGMNYKEFMKKYSDVSCGLYYIIRKELKG